MLRRTLGMVASCLLATASPLLVTAPTAAQAAEPAAAIVERTVVTTDGAMYRGEVVDYVVGDHITLKLDGGELKRIAFNDAARISPPSAKGQSVAPPPPSLPVAPSPPAAGPSPSGPPPAPGAVRTSVAAVPVPTVVPPGTLRMITTRDDLTIHGEILEYEVGSHILCQLADGDKRRIAWAEAKKISPPRNRRDDPSATGGAERTIILRDGKTLRGELVESLLGEYTRLKLPSGQLVKVAWPDARRILLPHQGSGGAIPVTAELLVTTDSGSRIQGEYFEHLPDDYLILRHASGRLRVIPIGTIRKIVVLQENASQ